jgi:hypothetical protein
MILAYFEVGKRHNKTFCIHVDWLDGLIGLGGLQFVVSYLLQSQFLWVMLRKDKQL